MASYDDGYEYEEGYEESGELMSGMLLNESIMSVAKEALSLLPRPEADPHEPPDLKHIESIGESSASLALLSTLVMSV